MPIRIHLNSPLTSVYRQGRPRGLLPASNQGNDETKVGEDNQNDQKAQRALTDKERAAVARQHWKQDYSDIRVRANPFSHVDIGSPPTPVNLKWETAAGEPTNTASPEVWAPPAYIPDTTSSVTSDMRAVPALIPDLHPTEDGPSTILPPPLIQGHLNLSPAHVDRLSDYPDR